LNSGQFLDYAILNFFQRDSWMVESSLRDFDALPSITKSDFNEQRQKKKDEEKGVEDKIPVIVEASVCVICITSGTKSYHIFH
jgi:hypothetical protein